ncbi:XRE family transcriptional regulator [Photorhabdus luminescens]|uniref:XRE family transcriptional regulator n=1 Tax=Photorhabdus luminescens subsp. mexicana TaxID=2100167 RepID=A0A4R4JQX7_PHOLU|nr:XRE family transcriptional regulator [Photorhabdus luminescens]OWO81389.1 XRE family transcriptional regulator [Photorhabdus luminescens]TDB56101.1 XRE family transcriptional regulator [Photorhabdus luminescens subsp. mexicana]
MSKLSEIASLYKQYPVVVEEKNVEGNSFTDMILQTKNAATAAFDKLAYLAGIKNAPADDKYAQLNTSNLSELLSSAKKAGYDVEVVNI